MVENAWQFASVIELNNHLSSGAEIFRGVESPHLSLKSPSDLLPSSDDAQNPPGLGNFDKIWRYLNLPLSAPSIKIESPPEVLLAATVNGNLRDTSHINKGARWCDGTESADPADVEETRNTLLSVSRAKILTKKERQRSRHEELEREKSSQKVVAEVADKRYNLRQPRLRSATEAVIQQILSDTVSKPKPLTKLRPSSGKLTATINQEKQFGITSLSLEESNLNSTDPTAHKIAAEKKKQLIRALRTKFPEEQKYLDNISAVPQPDESTKNEARKIHVFVDASNIMIGFQDCLKRSRGIPISTRMRCQPFSYHNLSLILERGRPTSKRVLVGSDNFPAIHEAKLIGYETNILERVHKAKELTPRQKKFSKKYNNNSSSYNTTNNNTTTGQSSSSETTAAFAPEKWVEQAVDEILHLKILESVVDALTPSTIVLATGDAAEAEYSAGFLKMVERALEKGWKVELVSFKHNISGAYKRKEFRGKWNAQFKIIILDGYLEQLLGS